jgi:hypothetical protein
MVHYYITLRKISAGKFTNEIDLGAIRYLRVPDGQLPDPSDAIPRTQWVREIIAKFPLVTGLDGKQRPTGDLTFFVHGYNNTIENVSSRQKLLQDGINQDGYNCPVQFEAARARCTGWTGWFTRRRSGHTQNSSRQDAGAFVGQGIS